MLPLATVSLIAMQKTSHYIGYWEWIKIAGSDLQRLQLTWLSESLFPSLNPGLPRSAGLHAQDWCPSDKQFTRAPLSCPSLVAAVQKELKKIPV